MKTYKMTCPTCNKSDIIGLEQREIDADYDITCDYCGKQHLISEYNIELIKEG